MPSPLERLTGLLTERGRQQSAEEWVEKELGETEKAARDTWKRLEELSNARDQLRDSYSDTAAQLSEWQEQGSEIKRLTQKEEEESLQFRYTAHELSQRVNTLELLSHGLSYSQFTEILTKRTADFARDRHALRDATDPLLKEEPPPVLPQYNASAAQQPASAAQARLATSALETLPTSGHDRSASPTGAPPAYSPTARPPSPPATSGPQGPQPRPRSR